METHDHEDMDFSGKVILPDDSESDEHWVECDYCSTELALSTDELAQGWYVCPECGELSHLAEIVDDDNKPAPKFPTRESTADLVPLTEVAGAEAATLVVSYLRANGVEAYTWQEGAGRAFGLTVGSLGASRIVVPEDQVELARSILEAEAEDNLNENQPADDAFSDASRAVMGLTALTLSPIGAGIAYGLSRVMGGHKQDEGSNLVECPHCGATLELPDEEVAQGHFICPECQQLVRLADYTICPACQAELTLDEAERQQGWYRCPECDRVTQL